MTWRATSFWFFRRLPAIYDGTTDIVLMHSAALEDLPAQVSKAKKNRKPKK